MFSQPASNVAPLAVGLMKAYEDIKTVFNMFTGILVTNLPRCMLKQKPAHFSWIIVCTVDYPVMASGESAGGKN